MTDEEAESIYQKGFQAGWQAALENFRSAPATEAYAPRPVDLNKLKNDAYAEKRKAHVEGKRMPTHGWSAKNGSSGSTETY